MRNEKRERNLISVPSWHEGRPLKSQHLFGRKVAKDLSSKGEKIELKVTSILARDIHVK